MHSYRQLTHIVLLLLMILLLPLIADYYLLFVYKGTLSSKLTHWLNLMEKHLLWIRLGFVCIYFLFWFLIVKMPGYQKPQSKRPKPGKRIKIIISLCTLISLPGFLLEAALLNAHQGLNLLFFVGVVICLPCICLLFFDEDDPAPSMVKRAKCSDVDAITFKTSKNWVNLEEPFRHTLVIAGTGSGKSVSILRPALRQFIEKGYCGILYDYKYPSLTDELHTLLKVRENKVRLPLYILNFEDVRSCHRCNPLKAEHIQTVHQAEELASSIYFNLDVYASRRQEQFFSQSAINWLTALIWFYREHHPAQCTLPHIFYTVLYEDFRHVFSMLVSHPLCAAYLRSILTSLEEKAERQLSGQVASLQNVMAKLLSPELCWILSGDDFDLDISDPEAPKLLSIGNSASIRKSLAPIIGCIFTAALQRMNVAGKHKSFVMLDEAPTLYLHELDHLCAVARSNRIAFVYAAQDPAMILDMYGREKAHSLISNMNNKFFGRINLPETARMVMETIGREEKERISKSESSTYSKNHQLSLQTGFSLQEKPVVSMQEIMNLSKGEFIGRTTDEHQPYFRAQFSLEHLPDIKPVQPFVHFHEKASDNPVNDMQLVIQRNASRIEAEVKSIITSYHHVYASS